MEKLASRKLWVAIGASAAAIFGAVSGSMPWAEALQSVAAIAIGYCVAQGWVDGKALEGAYVEEDE